MLKKILLALVLIVAAFLVVVALQPSEFSVERTTTIAATPEAIFPHVNDLHKWDAWSPWAKLDPNAKVGFGGPDAGEGATMDWAGNDEVGAGKMTITESKPNDLVKFRIDFTEPFVGTSTSSFTFKPDGDKTAVSWGMEAHHKFIEKALCLVSNGKGMVEGQLDEGLAKLKSVVEQAKS